LIGGTGILGETGLQGETGIQGVTGLIGGTGIQGVTGLIGGTGILGETGIQGVTGLALGSTGIQGVTGLIGGTGILGETGIQGVTGILGTSGVTGLIGGTGIGDDIRSFSWILTGPVAAGIPGCRLKETTTATEISASTTAASGIRFNVQYRDNLSHTGNTLLATAMIAGITGMSTTTLQNTSMTAGYWLWLDLQGITGAPGTAAVTLTGTV
jgi:hypothetical protein